ncbi:MAG: amidohydrolase family protein, partial [Bacteroidia bacterium]|nr:amidohydrolase family protein [Bacteroidia bacterium]MDW8158771.1 amidohydrolase family protein [Bacteroidia bacterium]
ASNEQLNIVAEIQCLQAHYPLLSLEKLIKAATYNGAKFLGLEKKIGEITINKAPGLVNIFPFDANNKRIPSNAQIRVLVPACFD